MTLLQEVMQLMTDFGANNTSIEDLHIRSEEELNIIKNAYENKLPKAKYPGKIKIGAGYNIPHKS